MVGSLLKNVLRGINGQFGGIPSKFAGINKKVGGLNSKTRGMNTKTRGMNAAPVNPTTNRSKEYDICHLVLVTFLTKNYLPDVIQ
ncbi:hypothetical protein J1P26_02740 [Neobacillus sp. MM2021_6]|uniref:hypothetical protein n=1 Tax=Bacillaceae TaxID=186817 RepID=UPI00140A726B|nr:MULTISPECIES: hypothetical protein [Bacillaceae]MBO0958635.1 hypothetical protein [Neobacillus sp. MM2021_6]NHC20224.1 hypothetical protein [Bacillus sp. MM2020_4]